MGNENKKIIAIVGATATGKSSFAVLLAQKLKNAEIVSVDSRQIYRGLDLGTGKVTKREMGSIPHHLLDVADPKRQYSVARFVKDADKAIKGILKRGNVPILVGGTGFYFDALVRGVSIPDVKPDAALRKRLSARSAEALFEELEKLDPERAAEIDPRNKVRLVRAIEIATALGKVPKPNAVPRYDALWIGCALPDEVLKEKILIRLKERMKRGMVKEAERLYAAGLPYKRMEALGLEYRHLASLLQKKVSKEAMTELLERDIRGYAKRQKAWFKRYEDIAWIDPRDSKSLKDILAYLSST